jgi:serine/threonine protein kinase
MEYCQNGTLFDFIREKGIKSDLHAAKLFSQIASAMKYCHEKGVAHRDLKSLNILLDGDDHVKICGFALCTFFVPDEKFLTFRGSLCYTSPECIQHLKYDPQKSDIWSLGVILYEMIVGNYPWKIKNYPKMIKAITTGSYRIPKAVEANRAQVNLIKGILKLNPNERLSLSMIINNSWIKKGMTRKSNSKISPFQMNQNRVIKVWEFRPNESDRENCVISPFANLKVNAN